jgi:cytochrome c oxidase cbb3-type subunit IV
MDANDLRAAWTLLSFLAFVGIAIWAYSGRSKARFDAAAQLPLEDDHPRPGRAAGNDKGEAA